MSLTWISPTPTFSPWYASISSLITAISQKCAIWCSAPDAGRECPVICMASPDNNNPYINSSYALISLLLNPSKDSFNLSSASYSISQIRSQIYSPSRIFVIFQSARAVYFPNRSPTPDAVSLIGASVMIRLSATTKIGDSAIILFLNPYHDIAATVDT